MVLNFAEVDAPIICASVSSCGATDGATDSATDITPGFGARDYLRYALLAILAAAGQRVRAGPQKRVGLEGREACSADHQNHHC